MAMRMIGTWDIVSSPDFDEAYLTEEGPPYIQLRGEGDRIGGEYRLGLQNGTLDGRPQRDGSILFSFDGMDEMEEVYGAATATLHDDHLVFTLMYHRGDDYTFEATRRS
jgi:hypothetical protein